MIGGVDEAGRGCVLGPLVIGIAVAKESVAEGLLRHGVKDSKELTPKKREHLAVIVRKECGVLVLKIIAEELNELMARHVSLNEIEAMRIAGGLMRLGEGVKRVYVDSPDTKSGKFEKRIRKYFDAPFELVCENKADANYPIVSAASIVAKVERDAEIGKIKKLVGYDFNSGYSSDPVTIAYLEKNLHNPALQPYIRKEWKTITRMRHRKLNDFEA
ncbi:Ribonuclease HII [Candidatus Burarchaeum australiense]|nr:Ribonuclease HII [Candidatus Burarchaeum australiense]